MNALLDTHVFMWWITDDPRMSQRARQVFGNPDVDLLLSAASAWEIAIKAGAGKLELEGDLERFVPEQLDENGIEVLPVELAHALRAGTLPGHHRDPFDRLLVAQAQLERIPIVTGDPLMKLYDVEVIW